jgi:hypothetical protein
MAARSTGNSTSTRRSSSSTTKRSSSSGTRKTSSRQGGSTKRSAQVQPEPGFTEKIKESPILSRLMMPVIFIIVVLAITGIDLLVAWNDFSRFFKILGVEILAAVIIWIMKMVFSKSRSSDDSVSEV